MPPEETTLTKPADLKPHDRIDTAIGTLIVHHDPYEALCDDTPEFSRVLVDVVVERPGQFGDADRLPEVTGAAEFQWLGSTPTLRYRLAFRPDADVEVAR